MPTAGPPRTFKSPDNPTQMEAYNKFVEEEDAMMRTIERLWKTVKTTEDLKKKKT